MELKDVIALKDVAIVVAALVGMLTGLVSLVLASANLLVVAKNFLVGHPSYKGIADRELQVYDKVNTFDAALSPLLTKMDDAVEVERTNIADVRDRLKTLAADVFCPELLRTDLYRLIAHLRQFERGEGKKVKVPTRETRELWQAVKDQIRRRIRQFVSYSEPHLLFKQLDNGDCEFIGAFRSRWQRALYIDAHKNNRTNFTYWATGEKPPFLRRLLT